MVRAGAGRFLTRTGLFDNVFTGAHSPFQPFLEVTNVSVDRPGAALSVAEQAPLTVTTKARDLRPPEAWNWNVTVQREFFWKSVLEASTWHAAACACLK